MTVKLNLTIDEKIVRRIKSYARRNKTSISKIVEKQLEDVLKVEKRDDSFRRFLDKYAGSIKREKPVDIRKERDDYLKQKHGL